MNRRSFMQSILVACAAPAIVRADSLMRIIPRELTIWTPGAMAAADLAADAYVAKSLYGEVLIVNGVVTIGREGFRVVDHNAVGPFLYPVFSVKELIEGAE